VRLVFLILGLLSFFNGSWMLVSPESWYTDLPAGVPDTGPYNGHFIRDLGLVFVMIAFGFFWCTHRPSRSWPVLFVITIFFSGHAVLHLLDLFTSRLPHSHWTMDTPAVFLPAALLIALTIKTKPAKL
jgi:hypothetical protein